MGQGSSILCVCVYSAQFKGGAIQSRESECYCSTDDTSSLGPPIRTIAKPQLVQNMLANLFNGTSRCDYKSYITHALHWLTIYSQAQVKVFIIYKALNVLGSHIYLTCYATSQQLCSTRQLLLSLPEAELQDVLLEDPHLWNSLPPAVSLRPTWMHVFEDACAQSGFFFIWAYSQRGEAYLLKKDGDGGRDEHSLCQFSARVHDDLCNI